MAAGQEIKRLRGSISAERAAKLIGVDSARLRKWEQRDVDPKDSGDINSIESYFGCKLSDLKNLDSFKFEPKEKVTSGGKESVQLLIEHLSSLEKENFELKQRIAELEKSALSNSNELKEFAVASQAILRTLHKSLTEHRIASEKIPEKSFRADQRRSLAEETLRIATVDNLV